MPKSCKNNNLKQALSYTRRGNTIQQTCCTDAFEPVPDKKPTYTLYHTDGTVSVCGI
jgi:hypothetical protein